MKIVNCNQNRISLRLFLNRKHFCSFILGSFGLSPDAADAVDAIWLCSFFGMQTNETRKTQQTISFPIATRCFVCVYRRAKHEKSGPKTHYDETAVKYTKWFFFVRSAFVKQCSTCSLSLSIALFLLSAFFHFQRPKRLTMRTNRR